jgi:sec-independent protein translocase protein TatC
MTLGEHFREFRRRLFIAAASIAVAAVVAGIFYDQVFDFLSEPFNEYKRANPQSTISLNFGEATSALSNLISLSIFVGVLVSSPIWLYQIWAFIVPGLHDNEKKYSRMFACVAGPLFIAGVALGYYVMPKGISVLFGFTPHGVSNFIDSAHYLDFIVRVLLVFGISFEIPFFVVLLNLAGVVRAHHLARWRSWIIFGTFLFAAVATPSTDPITMLLLAMPMVVLFLLSEVIAHIVDRRRGISEEPDYADLDDDETSPI